MFDRLEQIVGLIEGCPEGVYVRFAGEHPDSVVRPSVDYESGTTLPGAAANPLNPPAWWGDRPVEAWVARRIRTYAHLQERDPTRVCWVCTGREVDRGPDNEPLLAEVRVLGIVPRELVVACERHAPPASRPEDESPPQEAAPWQTA